MASQLTPKRAPEKTDEEKAEGGRGFIACSSVLAVIGAVDLAVASASGFDMAFLEALGLLAIIAAVGVWLRKGWGLWVGIVSDILTLTAGLATLYASASYVGFPTDLNALVLYLGLTIYTLAALATLLYLTTRRSAFKPIAS